MASNVRFRWFKKILFCLKCLCLSVIHSIMQATIKVTLSQVTCQSRWIFLEKRHNSDLVLSWIDCSVILDIHLSRSFLIYSLCWMRSYKSSSGSKMLMLNCVFCPSACRFFRFTFSLNKGKGHADVLNWGMFSLFGLCIN